MFDLIEEELSSEKSNPGSQGTFTESENPVYTMPTTYRRERGTGGGGSNKKLMLIIFGSLFVLAIAGTVIFLFLSRPQTPPSAPEQPTTSSEQPSQEQPPQQPSPQSEEQPVLEPGIGIQESPGEQQPSSTPVPTPQEQQTAVPLLGIDADQDGLTDVEERLYSADPQKADTDSDSFFDGDEVKNMYDPLRGEQSRLDVSGLVNTYTNQTFLYSLLYPSSWVAQSTDRSDREVMISSATGEFFTISVLDNPNRLSPIDWYARQAAPGSDTSRLQSFTYETWSGVMTQDSLTVYLTRNDSDPDKKVVMYVLKYNLNTKNEINFLSTLQMMLKSFVFTDLSFVR